MTISDGQDTFKGDQVTGDKLDATVVWHGTTLPTNPTNEVPANGLFLKTDTGIFYENTGTISAPVFTERAGIDLSLIQTFLGVQIEAGISFSALRKTFEEFFSGTDLAAIWTKTDGAGTSTFALIDGIGEGLQITTGGTSSDRGTIEFNAIRNFNPASCTMYGIIKYDNSANVCGLGISNTNEPVAGNVARKVVCELRSTLTNVGLASSDGTTSTTESDVALSTNDVIFKIVCASANLKLYLLVAGVWTLKVTKTTNRPVAAGQPVFQVITTDTSTAIASAKYFKVTNDT